MKRNTLVICLLSSLLLSSCSFGEQIESMEITYNYGGYRKDKITPLFDDGVINIDNKEFLAPGDTLIISYTGKITSTNTSPLQYEIKNGEIKSFKLIKTKVDRLNYVDESTSLFDKYSYPKYIVTDKEYNYVSIDEYKGDFLYYSVDINILSDGNWEHNNPNDLSLYPLAGLFSFNPRG